jgi:hypothetical protein
VAVGQEKAERRKEEEREKRGRLMLQLTSRDEAMLDWMNVVRLADVEAVRWALSAYQNDHDGGPVSIRRANYWIARMAELGYLGRVRPMYRDRQIVWPTYKASGRPAPRLFRLTMRHELAVAAIAGRFVAAGYEWARDAMPSSARDHQADGVARLSGAVELVEVELTPKKASRYQSIMERYGLLIEAQTASAVHYLCTAGAAALVSKQADRFVVSAARSHLAVSAIFDEQGRMQSSWDLAGMLPSRPVTIHAEPPTV